MKLVPVTSEVSYLKIAKKLLEEGIMMVHLMREREGVVVPESCNTKVVRLNFSYRYMIDDFRVDKKGIRASLSFGGVPTWCDIPWQAVVALSSQVTDEFYIWLDAFSEAEMASFLPPEVHAEMKQSLSEGSIFDVMPELRDYAVDETDRLDGVDEADDDDDDDDDDVEYTPLHFV